MEARRVYLCSTDKKGRVTITEHTCWDSERFLEARAKDVQEHGGKVEVITQEEYRAAVWPPKRG